MSTPWLPASINASVGLLDEYIFLVIGSEITMTANLISLAINGAKRKMRTSLG
jgi:hypothetical protein